MKTLELIRYIAQRDKFKIIVFDTDFNEQYNRFEAIDFLASIDPSNYDSIYFKINADIEPGTLIVHKIG